MKTETTTKKKKAPEDGSTKVVAKKPVKVSKEFNPLDLLAVEYKEPGYAYRWVNKKALPTKRALGWEPVKRSKEQVEEYAEYGVKMGTTIERQDLILCRMPTALCDKIKKARKDRADRQINAIRRQGLKRFSKGNEDVRGTGSLETLRELGIGQQDEAWVEKEEKIKRSRDEE